MQFVGLLSSALAQDPGTFDAHGFVSAAPTGDALAPLVLPRPVPYTPGLVYGGVVFELADKPLVYVLRQGETIVSREVLVEDLYVANVGVGWAPARWLRVGAVLPAYLAATGTHGGAGLGDLRIDAQVLLVDAPRHHVGIGLQPLLDLPTGNVSAYQGDGATAVGGRAVGTWEPGPAAVTIGAGARVTTGEAVDAGEILGGASLGLRLAPIATGLVEVDLRAPLAPTVDLGGTAVEVLGAVRLGKGKGPNLVVGGAVGATQAASTARYRLFLGGGWSTGGPDWEVDADGDGLVDGVDTCPEAAETMNAFEDHDGCPDDLAPGGLEVRAELDGTVVPGVTFGVRGPSTALNVRGPDGRWTLAEATPGVWTAEALVGGCLSGTATAEVLAGQGATLVVPLAPRRDATVRFEVVDPAGQPVPGARVRFAGEPGCAPAEPVLPDVAIKVAAGAHQATASAEGYQPASKEVIVGTGGDAVTRLVLTQPRVRLEDRKIAVLSPIQFETGTARLSASSEGTLTEVVTILQAHPELRRVEIAGHTDAEGSDDENLQLSRRRVEAVRAWLLARGIAPERLVAVGYGETTPVDTNATESGRARNRRVEFVILERATGPTAPAPGR